MRRLRVMVTAVVGAALGFVLAVQLQWVVIHAAASDEGCDDLGSGSTLCVKPEPLDIVAVAGAAVGAALAILVLRRMYSGGTLL